MENFLLRCKTSSLLLFGIFAFTIFLKCVLFHYFCFNYIALSSLFRAPLEFFAFYVAKIYPALIIASFVFIIKNRWWIVVVSLFVDLWLSANYIYYCANDFFLDLDTILIAANLAGFTGSIYTYLSWRVYVYFIVTICLIGILFFCEEIKKIKWQCFSIIMAIAICLVLYENYWGFSKMNSVANKNIGVPAWKYSSFKTVKMLYLEKNFIAQFVLNQWVEAQTPLHFFPSLVYAKCCQFYYRRANVVKITEEENKQIANCLNLNLINNDKPKQNLVLILGESFESWVIQIKDKNGVYVTPNLRNIIQKQSVLYASKIKSQARGGNSGDGQMIVNTGLLPLQSGAACMLFGENVYPNFSHFYLKSAVINPSGGNVWNQSSVTYSYGYKSLIQSISKKNIDGILMDTLYNYCRKQDSSFCVMAITLSTHTPFLCEGMVQLNFEKDMPENCKNYLNCMHYADSCIGNFISRMEANQLMQNTTIVITGDHTIFKSAMLREFQPFAKKYKYPIPVSESFCPLIIYSSIIENRIEIDELCYQMDIFPTILYCIGAKDYYWKGFGVNLLDSISRCNRVMTEKKAYLLSDKMIRNNYFKDNER